MIQRNPSYLSPRYTHSQSSISSSFQSSTQSTCIFCTSLNITHCMSISVLNKHYQKSNFHYNLIESLLLQQKSSAKTKFNIFIINILDQYRYEEIIKDKSQEHINKLYSKQKIIREIKELLEYYKFRIFIPIFIDQQLGHILHTYNYQKLKIYYNLVKKQLNITVQQSQSTIFEDDDSEQKNMSNQSISKTNILSDLTQGYEFNYYNHNHNPNNSNDNKNVNQYNEKNKDVTQSIQYYKTQSKAFQDLVKVFKSYETNFQKKAQQLKLLKNQQQLSNWKKIKKSSREMFKDHILQNKNSSNLKKSLNIQSEKNKILITFYTNSINGIRSQSTLSRQNGSLSATKKQIQKKSTKKIDTQKDLKKNSEKSSRKSLQKPQMPAKLSESARKAQQNMRNSPQIISTITPLKLHKNSQLQKQLLSKKLFQKTPIQYKKQPKQGKLIKGRSQARLQRQSRSLSNRKQSQQKFSTQGLLSNRKLSVRKLDQIHKQKQKSPKQKQSNQQQPLKTRRKSLDLTKLKSILIIGQTNLPSILQSKHNEEGLLPFKYQKIQNLSSTKRIVPSSGTPNQKYMKKDQINQISIQKNDNIISIKKKKLEMLKKKVQIQKSARKS